MFPFFQKKDNSPNNQQANQVQGQQSGASQQEIDPVSQAAMLRSQQKNQLVSSVEARIPLRSQKSLDYQVKIPLVDMGMYNSTTSIPQEQILSFDNVLNDIGFGKYQLWIYCIMGLNGITEGSQITIFTLMLPILKHQWGVSDKLNSLQASFVFVGFLLGSMISGQFADRLGRRRPFVYSSFFVTLFSFGSILCHNIYSLLMMRALMGILVGFFAPCGVTMLSEITPVNLRGRYMGLITLTFALGQLFGLFVASLTLSTLNDGNWQAMTFWCTVPGGAAWVLCLTKLDESARFELLSKHNEKAFEIIEQMSRDNKSDFVLDEQKKYKLVNWALAMNRIAKNQQNGSIGSLFSGGRGLLTGLLWFNWFSLSFMYYGIVLLLPFTLLHINETNTFLGNDKLLQLVISCISDISGAFVASFLIEVKGFGRKNSLIIFFACQSVTSVMVYVDSDSHFILWATVSKFFLSMTFIFSFQYTAEVYPTKIRTTGVGMANGIGRLGGVIMPWVCFYLADLDLLSPFLLFSVISLITSLTNFALPFDTTGKELDQ